jgi:hypothetical protein
MPEDIYQSIQLLLEMHQEMHSLCGPIGESPSHTFVDNLRQMAASPLPRSFTEPISS